MKHVDFEVPVIHADNSVDWDKVIAHQPNFDDEHDSFSCPLPDDHPVKDNEANRAVWNPQSLRIEIRPC